jgi:hypothetical protein
MLPGTILFPIFRNPVLMFSSAHAAVSLMLLPLSAMSTDVFAQAGGSVEALKLKARSRASTEMAVTLAVHAAASPAWAQAFWAAKTALEKLLVPLRYTVSTGNLLVAKTHGLLRFIGLLTTSVSYSVIQWQFESAWQLPWLAALQMEE